MKVLESSLNLRVDRKANTNKNNLDYKLSKAIAIEQLEYVADLYCNVEYMECEDEEYLYEFSKAGYKRITALFGNDNRGILCYVKKEFSIQIIERRSEPHFVHFKIYNDKEGYDIIVFRILVSDGKQKDYNSRLEQWNDVMAYVDKMKDKSRIIIMGDWNHGYIRDKYNENEHFQYLYNYQKIRNDLTNRGITMGMNLNAGHKEHSYLGYLAIDHIAIGEHLSFKGKPQYSEYMEKAPIGTPDHAYFFADIC